MHDFIFMYPQFPQRIFLADPFQLDYDTELVPKSKWTITCDANASCGCGLLSGKYVCICHVGYYGSGFIGGCKGELVNIIY